MINKEDLTKFVPGEQDFVKYPNVADFQKSKHPPMKAISLFAGIGGLDLAGHWAGIETVAFCERERYSQLVLKKNFEGSYIVGKDKRNEKNVIPIFDDVKTLNKGMLDNEKVPQCQIVTGGFPCQPYSHVGERRGDKDGRSLFGEMARIAHDECHAPFFLGENTVGLQSLGLDGVISTLEDFGYEVGTYCFPALSTNAQIVRYRVAIFGCNPKFLPMPLSERWAADVSGFESGQGDGEDSEHWSRWFKVPAGSYNGRPVDSAGVRRTIDVVPSRVDRLTRDRLKALGNAINPMQFYPIMRYIKYMWDLMLDDFERQKGSVRNG